MQFGRPIPFSRVLQPSLLGTSDYLRVDEFQRRARPKLDVPFRGDETVDQNRATQHPCWRHERPKGQSRAVQSQSALAWRTTREETPTRRCAGRRRVPPASRAVSLRAAGAGRFALASQLVPLSGAFGLAVPSPSGGCRWSSSVPGSPAASSRAAVCRAGSPAMCRRAYLTSADRIRWG